MKISIAMATYNGAAWLEAQLQSLAAQTRLPDELVITDDRSTDATVQIARDFGKTAPFEVRVEVNPGNLGVRGNFERALSLCVGDIILLCDQDDVWSETKVERHLALLATHPEAACVMTDATLTDGALNSVGRTKLGALRAAGLPDRDFVMGCCASVRRTLVDLALPIPTVSRAHDSWIVGLSDALGLTLRLEEPLQLYRRHGANDSLFFVNALETPSLAERLKDRISGLQRRIASTAGADRELGRVAAMSERLAERNDLLVSMVGEEAAARARRTLADRHAVLLRRREIRDLPALGRARAAAALWRGGGYSRSGGLAGLLKDVISPRVTEPAP